MKYHCADVHRGRRAVFVQASAKAFHEMTLVKEHVDLVNPGEVRREEMLNENRCSSNAGPVQGVRIPLKSSMRLLDGFAELSFPGRQYGLGGSHRRLLYPFCNRLMRIPSIGSFNNFEPWPFSFREAMIC